MLEEAANSLLPRRCFKRYSSYSHGFIAISDQDAAVQVISCAAGLTFLLRVRVNGQLSNSRPVRPVVTLRTLGIPA